MPSTILYVPLFAIAVVAAVLVASQAHGLARHDVEQPAYDVIESQSEYEIRSYNPHIIAQVTVDGPHRSASNRGFRLLADYIFGNNTAAAGEAQKIEMTAPVLQQAASQEIEMTAPVLQTATEADRFEVAFIMPSEFTMDTLPTPNNDQVNLEEVPGRTMAVLSFSGTTPERVIAEKTDALLESLESDGVEVVGAPVLARFDPPWTLPHRRLNEVMVEVALSSTVE